MTFSAIPRTLLLLAVAATALTGCDAGQATDGLHMVDHDGHRLAFHVTAGDLPAIVLDAGGGEDSTQWTAIVAKLHAETKSQIITYDRAGVGDSEAVPGPWDPQAAAGDLEAGLHELGVTKDVLLVAHSQAGEVATYLARKNPQLISHALLVDANLPQFFTEEETARVAAAVQPQVDAAKADPTTKANRQLLATAASYLPVHQAYHQLTWPDSIPATVIVSEKTPFDGFPEDAQRWRTAAAAFVAAGPGRSLVTAAGSSHEVPTDRPDLVIQQIETIAAART